MTDIIGHDCDGRPLRVGDRVVVASRRQYWLEGMVCTVIGTSEDGDVRLSKTNLQGLNYEAVSSHLRKLPDDKPANQSFEELMNQLNREGATT